jgi:DNA-binding GntR family transcriptional regulator
MIRSRKHYIDATYIQDACVILCSYSKQRWLSVSSPPSASERAYRYVKERILQGDLPGGDMITEGQIVAGLSMSRTPVREAFLRLEAEGWLKLFPKRGALVVPVQPDEMEQVLEARQLIESHAVQVISQDLDRARVLGDELLAITEQMGAAMRRDDIETFTSLDAEFHLVIVASAGNDILSDIYRGLRDRLRRMTTRSVWRDRGRMEGIMADHTELAEIVGRGDREAFSKRLLEHMLATHSRTAGRRSPLPPK